MRFFTVTAFTSLCALVAAVPQTAPAAVPSAAGVTAISSGTNPITYPLGEDAIKSGKTITITWTPTYGSTVNLNLRKGRDTNNLDLDDSIAADIPNTGSYSWTVPDNLDGTTYSIEIVSGNVANYSPQFEVNDTGVIGDATEEASSSAVVKPATATSSATSSTTPAASSSAPTSSATVTASKNATSTATKSDAEESKTKSTGIPSGAPSAVAADEDSAAVRAYGSGLAMVAGLVAAAMLLN